MGLQEPLSFKFLAAVIFTQNPALLVNHHHVVFKLGLFVEDSFLPHLIALLFGYFLIFIQCVGRLEALFALDMSQVGSFDMLSLLVSVWKSH